MSCCDTLPSSCCAPLPCPTLNIQGPPGQSSFAPLIGNLTVPVNTATPVTINVTSTAWMLPGMKVLVGDTAEGVATFTVVSITSPTAASLLWIQAPGDVASGTTFTTANLAGAAPTGAPGFGVNGINGYTVLTANATVPADFVTPVNSPNPIAVANTQWITVGQYLVIGNATDGVFTVKVTAIPSTTTIIALWVNARGDLGSGSTVTVANGGTVSPSGAPATLGPRSSQEVASGSSQNSGSALTPLLFYNIPAGGVSTNGDYLDIEATFEIAANGNTKTVNVVFGATTIATIAAAQNVNPSLLVITARITRLTSTTQFAYSMIFITSGGTMNAVTTAQSAPGESLGSQISIVCSAQSSAVSSGDIKQRTLRVRYVPI